MSASSVQPLPRPVLDRGQMASTDAPWDAPCALRVIGVTGAQGGVWTQAGGGRKARSTPCRPGPRRPDTRGQALLTPQAAAHRQLFCPPGLHRGHLASRRGPPASRKLSDGAEPGPGSGNWGLIRIEPCQSHLEPSLASEVTQGHRKASGGKVCLLVSCQPGGQPCPPQPQLNPCTGWNGAPQIWVHPEPRNAAILGNGIFADIIS